MEPDFENQGEMHSSDVDDMDHHGQALVSYSLVYDHALSRQVLTSKFSCEWESLQFDSKLQFQNSVSSLKTLP